MKRILYCFLAVSTIAPANAASRTDDLESWFQRDLVPYVRQQLTTLPRFRNESFRFVVMNDDSPQSEGSALVIDLRNRLRDTIADVPGIRVAWQADQPGVGLVASSASLDCTRNDANYFVGIELQETGAGRIRINVRALDIEEGSWVAGFNRSWQGPVSASQRQRLRTISSDPTFRGERNAPWKDSETDLMAAHLAYELGCKLLGQTAGEYIVAGNQINGDVDATTALIELVSNNLAGVSALQFAAGESNAVIEGKAHRIDDDLFQYWVTITPTDSTSEMTALSADAYVQIPDRYKAATLVRAERVELPRSTGRFLSSFGVVRMIEQRACTSERTYFSDTSNIRGQGGDCFALQLRAEDDAVVFFLTHQLNYGLVRLADENCPRRTMAKVARANETVRMPLPRDSLQSGAWTDADRWSVSPRVDSYYALAATDTKAARALSKHIEKLPQRCGASVRPGIEGDALRHWLDELTAMAEHWSPAIDWRSIRVKDVY